MEFDPGVEGATAAGRVASGDLDGDGSPDLVVPGFFEGPTEI